MSFYDRAFTASEDLFTLCLSSPTQQLAGSIWTSWSLAPEVLAPLLLLAVVYAGVQFRTASFDKLSVTRMALFVCSYGLLLAALISPLCRLAASLAFAHMVQHVILVSLAPPLLVFAFPASTWHRASLPLWLSGTLYGLAIWCWHVPAFYEAALVSALPHLLMYATLFISGVMFWSSILAAGNDTDERAAAAVLMLLATLVHTGMLGALLSFSPHAWYPIMAPGAFAWGLSPLDDQQLAGVIMWVPMGLVYLIAAMALAAYRLTKASVASVGAGTYTPDAVPTRLVK